MSFHLRCILSLEYFRNIIKSQVEKVHNFIRIFWNLNPLLYKDKWFDLKKKVCQMKDIFVK